MSRELLISSAGGELRAALTEDGALAALIVERQDRASLVGNIYLGRVQRVALGIAAAFVDIGMGRDGFLPLGVRGRDEAGENGESPPPLPPAPVEGEALCVQVVRDAFAGKGAQLSRRLSLAGYHLVYLPDGARIAVSRLIEDETERDRLVASVAALAEEGEGFVVRTAAEGAAPEELARDAAWLRARWSDIVATRTAAAAPMLLHAEPDPVERVLRDHAMDDIAAIRIGDAATFGRARAFCRRFLPDVADRLVQHRGAMPLFDAAGVEDAIEDALVPRVPLPSGGCIVIEGTEALTAIDVNSGSLTDRSGPDEAALRTNMEAAAEVPRQLRLRNTGGLVVVDFISMDDDGAWERVLAALTDGLARDRVNVRLVGRTASGLVEITRRRQRVSLLESLTERCDVCGGRGRVLTCVSLAHATVRRLRREADNGPVGALVVTAAPDLVTAIEESWEGGWPALEKALGRRIVINTVPGSRREAVDIHVE